MNITTMETVKEWVETYYEDKETSFCLYEPKNKENLIEHKVKCSIRKNERYMGSFEDQTLGGPLAIGDTLEECENKFHEMFLLSIFTSGFIKYTYKEITKIAKEVIFRNTNYVVEYKKGRKGLLGLFVGEVMKETKGKGEPYIINEIVLNILETI